MDIKARLRNWPLLVALGALLAVILADAGIAQAPEMVQKYLDYLYPVLIGLGIFVDPTSPGIGD